MGKPGLLSLLLWDAAKQTVKLFELSDVKAKLRTYALSPEGTHVGAVVESAAGVRELLVWETATRRVVCRINYQAVDLAFSPNSSLVVAWDEAGQLRLWTLPEAAPLATLRSGAATIRSVAFGRAPGRLTPTTAAARWLLAVGDAGGTVTLWDLEKQDPDELLSWLAV